MADQPRPKPKSGEPPAVDPDHVPEIICDGRLYVHANGPTATITFTHVRPDASAMIDRDVLNYASVVRARIVMSLNNLVALRDLLNRIIKENPPPGEKVH